MDKRNIRREARDALVHVIERLQVGQLRHHEESLLEWIPNGTRRYETLLEALFDELRHFQGMKYRSFDSNRNVAQASGCLWVGKQIVGEQRMQVQDRGPIEPDLIGRVDKKFDGILMG